MTNRDNPYDVAIVGGGIFGLWIARQCAAAGLKACLVDRAKIGCGASGGLLGALMPHMPDRWDAKKQFQFEALCALPQAVETLEAETGLASGYRRTGRVMPIRTQHFLDQIPQRQDGSKVHWSDSCLDLTFDLNERADATGWLSPVVAPLGHTFENLSARINPRDYLAALAASVKKTCSIVEHFQVAAIDPHQGILRSTPGSAGVQGADTIAAGAIVVAAGYESFPFLQRLTGLPLGAGLKGEALLLDTREDPANPIVYDDGTYVIVHDDGRTAVGSTSQAEWSDPVSVGNTPPAFLQKAALLVPRIAKAPILERWAGVRPRSRLRDPIVGTLPENPRLIVATGGFKISFGIAHKIAEAVVTLLDGLDPHLPKTFTPAHHLDKAKARRDGLGGR